MAVVYIWDTKKITGHASIEIGGEYVSFHPNLSNDSRLSRHQIVSYNKNSRISMSEIGMNEYLPFFSTINEDKELGDKLCARIELRGLDENYVSQYLKSDFDSDHSRYQLFKCNCSTVVAHLLLLGSHRFVRDHSFMGTMITKMANLNAILYQGESRDVQHNHRRRFDEIADALEQVAPAFGRFIVRPNAPIVKSAAAIVAAIDFVRRELTWTPGDVLHLAEYLRDH